jgi:hypothetical protein
LQSGQQRSSGYIKSGRAALVDGGCYVTQELGAEVLERLVLISLPRSRAIRANLGLTPTS